MDESSLTYWKIAGIVATLVIALSIPLYLAVEHRGAGDGAGTVSKPAADFVGSARCQSCHKAEFDKWQQSHHRMAMADASEETVRGDFADAVFTHFGTRSKFYRKNGKFFVYTQGPEGRMGEFPISHTFGWYPLQQYLVPFPGGRLQCLPIAWDVDKKRWYHLYPDQAPDPDDWLYWTHQAQNWNGMCAECHSTDLRKNYDMKKDEYRTRWSEISVGCEACHGPGSEHVRWAELPEMGRPEVENMALTVKTDEMNARQQIELCAPCHSRRMSLGDNIHSHTDFLDYGVPQLLSEGMYHADGQILEEVYVYGSFMQSKMYDREVRCSDCHDMHSARRVKEGNGLCLQCHRASVYDTRAHHFHKKAGEPGDPIRDKNGTILFDVGTGALCEQCHMPGRIYMGIDYRPDHSLRIPRPDLTLEIGTPNACNRCHVNQTDRWSVDAMAKWYGQKKRTHYGTILAAGRRMQPEALPDLVRLAEDRLYPAIVRATALSLVAAYPAEESRTAVRRALQDETALLRHTAVRSLVEPDPGLRLGLLTPLLYDSVRAVRIEAAQKLADVAPSMVPDDVRRQMEKTLAQYRKAMARSADFAASRHNLGNLAAATGDTADAVAHYRKAFSIDSRFYPSKVNLAMIYNRQGKNSQAEALLREVVANDPELYEVHYSLGLLQVEMKQYESAAASLQKAAAGLPGRSRVHYNLGLLMQQLGQDEAAERALQHALAVDPDHPEYLNALAVFYLQRGRLPAAQRIARKLATNPATRSLGERLLESIDRKKKMANPPSG